MGSAAAKVRGIALMAVMVASFAAPGSSRAQPLVGSLATPPKYSPEVPAKITRPTRSRPGSVHFGWPKAHEDDASSEKSFDPIDFTAKSSNFSEVGLESGGRFNYPCSGTKEP